MDVLWRVLLGRSSGMRQAHVAPGKHAPAAPQPCGKLSPPSRGCNRCFICVSLAKVFHYRRSCRRQRFATVEGYVERVREGSNDMKRIAFAAALAATSFVAASALGAEPIVLGWVGPLSAPGNFASGQQMQWAVQLEVD